MPIVITLAEKGARPEVRTFASDEVTIGRTKKDNDVVLDRGNVSKKHARIVVKDDKTILVDLKSTNGTYVNGKRVSAPQVLRPSDKVTIGDHVLCVGEGADVSGEGTAETEPLDWVVTIDGPDGRQQFAVMGDVTVGRSSTCEIPVLHKNVGRRQLRILPFSRYVAITDLGTALGTWVNGERISGSCRLSSSEDVVEFAAHRMWVHRPGEEPPTATGRPGMTLGASWMLQLQGPGSPELVAVTNDPVAVGKDESCRIRLGGDQMPGEHLRFELEREHLQVRVLAPAEPPTQLNGEEMLGADPRTLEPGDHLRVAGGLSIVVQSALPVRPPPPKPEVTVPRHTVGTSKKGARRRKSKPGVPRSRKESSSSRSGEEGKSSARRGREG